MTYAKQRHRAVQFCVKRLQGYRIAVFSYVAKVIEGRYYILFIFGIYDDIWTLCICNKMHLFKWKNNVSCETCKDLYFIRNTYLSSIFDSNTSNRLRMGYVQYIFIHRIYAQICIAYTFSLSKHIVKGTT